MYANIHVGSRSMCTQSATLCLYSSCTGAGSRPIAQHTFDICQSVRQVSIDLHLLSFVRSLDLSILN